MISAAVRAGCSNIGVWPASGSGFTIAPGTSRYCRAESGSTKSSSAPKMHQQRLARVAQAVDHGTLLLKSSEPSCEPS